METGNFKRMLSVRQRNILECVVKEYTSTANPVGSENILKHYNFPASSATIRLELAELEREGYLYQPHTSAGRIPTDKGYRYFVNSLMKNRELSLSDQAMLQEELMKLKAKNIRLTRTAAKLLATLSHNLAISGLIEEEEYFQSGVRELLSQPDFSDVDEVCKTVEVLDYLDQNIDHLLEDLEEGQVETFIGKENPLTRSENCSLIIARCRISKNQTGIIAIMGPKRMRYAKNISLVQYMANLLTEE